jgi:hypothetical protein
VQGQTLARRHHDRALDSSGMLETEKQFRRIKGFRDLQLLHLNEVDQQSEALGASIDDVQMLPRRLQ